MSVDPARWTHRKGRATCNGCGDSYPVEAARIREMHEGLCQKKAVSEMDGLDRWGI